MQKVSKASSGILLRLKNKKDFDFASHFSWSWQEKCYLCVRVSIIVFMIIVGRRRRPSSYQVCTKFSAQDKFTICTVSHLLLYRYYLRPTVCVCKEHVATKTKSISVEIERRHALNHKQTIETLMSQSGETKQSLKICVHSLQTAVPLRAHHSTQDIWSPAQIRRHSSAEVTFVPTPLLNAIEDTSQFLQWPTDYQSFYQMWWFFINFVCVTD